MNSATSISIRLGFLSRCLFCSSIVSRPCLCSVYARITMDCKVWALGSAGLGVCCMLGATCYLIRTSRVSAPAARWIIASRRGRGRLAPMLLLQSVPYHTYYHSVEFRISSPYLIIISLCSLRPHISLHPYVPWLMLLILATVRHTPKATFKVTRGRFANCKQGRP